MKWPKLMILCLFFSYCLAQLTFAGDIKDKMEEWPSIADIDAILWNKAFESDDPEWLKEILKETDAVDIMKEAIESHNVNLLKGSLKKTDAKVNHKQLFPKLNALSKRPGSKLDQTVLSGAAPEVTDEIHNFLETFLTEKLEDEEKLKTLISVYPFYLTTQQFFDELASTISSKVSNKYDTAIIKRALNIIYHLTEKHLPHGTPSTRALNILATLKSDDDEIYKLVAEIWIALKKGERNSQKEMLETSWTIPKSIDKEKSNDSIDEFGKLSPDAIFCTITTLLNDRVSKISSPLLARWVGEKKGKPTEVEEIGQLINLHSQIVNLLAMLIVKQEKPKERFKMVKKLLTMAQLFKETNNLLGVSLVGGAFGKCSVSRLLKGLSQAAQQAFEDIWKFSIDMRANLLFLASLDKSEEENKACLPNLMFSLNKLASAVEDPNLLAIRKILKHFEYPCPKVECHPKKNMPILMADTKLAMKLFHSINNISEEDLDELSEQWLPRNTGPETKAKH